MIISSVLFLIVSAPSYGSAVFSSALGMHQCDPRSHLLFEKHFPAYISRDVICQPPDVGDSGFVFLLIPHYDPSLLSVMRNVCTAHSRGYRMIRAA